MMQCEVCYDYVSSFDAGRMCDWCDKAVCYDCLEEHDTGCTGQEDPELLSRTGSTGNNARIPPMIASLTTPQRTSKGLQYDNPR